MKIYPLPKNAELYWLGIKPSGIYRRFTVGCHFKGGEQRTLINNTRVDEDTFYDEHCRECSYNYSNNHNLQDLVNKNKDLCTDIINQNSVEINRILRVVISGLVELTGVEYKKELMAVVDCEGYLEDQAEKLITWEIKVNELDHVIIGDPDLEPFIQKFTENLNINLSKEQESSLIAKVNDVIKRNPGGYIDKSRAGSRVKSYIEDELDEDTTCRGGYEVYDEDRCSASEAGTLDTKEEVTVSTPPHTFVVVEPYASYIFNNTDCDYTVGLPLICGNVYGDGGICWGHGTNANPSLENIAFLYEYFWSSQFIDDISGDVHSISDGISDEDYSYTHIISEFCGDKEVNSIIETFEDTKEKLVGLITLSHLEYKKFIDHNAIFTVSPIVGDENIATFVYADLVKQQLFIYDNVVSKIGPLSSQDKTKKLTIKTSALGVTKLVREKVKK